MRSLNNITNSEINRIIVVKLTKSNLQKSKKSLVIDLKNNRKHSVQIVCKYNIK